MKVQDLTGAKLDYWVARAEGLDGTAEHCGLIKSDGPEERWFVRQFDGLEYYDYSPSTRWEQGGLLVEKHRICLRLPGGDWYAHMVDQHTPGKFGDTPLIAICRAVVRAAFGDELEDLP